MLVEFLGNQPEAGIVGPRTYTGNGHIALTARVELSALTVLLTPPMDAIGEPAVKRQTRLRLIGYRDRA